jgi:hypothetical protein
MKPKHEPTLADALMSTSAHHTHYDPPRIAMLNAKRFVFDTGASGFLGMMLHKAARLILREHEFARQPYPQTWIEIDAAAYGIGLQGYVDNGDPATADKKFGYLYNNGTVYCAAMGPDGVGWSPLTLKLHHPVTLEQEIDIAQRTGHSRLTLRQALVGYAENITDSWWQGGELDALARSHLYQPALDLTREQNLGILQSHQGILKQALAVLLLLTRPGRRVLQFGEEKHKRVIWRGKNTLMMSHHTVKLHIDQSVALRRFITGIHTGLHRKHHDVRGHWAQTRRNQQNCTHVWDPIDPDHYRCLRCEAKRWWRKDHTRGQLELGTVTKVYEVVK